MNIPNASCSAYEAPSHSMCSEHTGRLPVTLRQVHDRNTTQDNRWWHPGDHATSLHSEGWLSCQDTAALPLAVVAAVRLTGTAVRYTSCPAAGAVYPQKVLSQPRYIYYK